MFQPGQRVSFGRPNGVKTFGMVVKVNEKSIKVKADTERGPRAQPGAVWRVHPSLVRAEDGQSEPPASESDLMRQLAQVYFDLEPEVLLCDGERSFAEVIRRRKALYAEHHRLIGLIGRPVDESEAMSYLTNSRL